MEVPQVLSDFYENYDEDGRLASRHGSVEFLSLNKIKKSA